MATRKVTKQIPHACPVCKGKGEVGPKLAQFEAQPKYDKAAIYACHVCGGSCLIWEIREEEELPPLINVQMPPSTLIPSIFTPLPQQPYTIGDPPYGVTWTCGIGDQTFKAANSPAWNLGSINGGGCACSPPGYPHHDNCKAG